MGLAALLWTAAFESTFDLGSQWLRLVEVLAGVAIGSLSYVSILRWIGLEEVGVLRKHAFGRMAGGQPAG